MDEKKKSVSANALLYGSLIGGVGIVYSLILYILDLSMNRWLGNVSFLFYLGGMILGTLQYRKQYKGDLMTYSQAVGCSFLIGLYATLILSIYSFIFFKFIDPGMIDRILEVARTQITTNNPQLSDMQVDQAMSITRLFTNAYVLPIMSILMSSFISIIMALLLAIFLKKEDNTVQLTN